MAHADLSPLIATVTADTDVISSATVFINGIAAMTQAAIDKALENGATAEELAPVQAVVDAQKAKADELAQAMVTNTPAAASRRR
jgi:hypothetical protein